MIVAVAKLSDHCRVAHSRSSKRNYKLTKTYLAAFKQIVIRHHVLLKVVSQRLVNFLHHYTLRMLAQIDGPWLFYHL